MFSIWYLITIHYNCGEKELLTQNLNASEIKNINLILSNYLKNYSIFKGEITWK